MDKNTFNHDKFNSWQKCKKRYYYKYIQELRWPESEDNYKLGQTVHALIDYKLRGLEVEHLLENIDEDTKTHWNAIQNSSILKNDVITTEWSFNCKVGNTKYWLNGRIDAIFYDKEQKKYIIADWKTGQNVPKDPENDYQSILYMYAFYNARKDLKLDLKPEDVIFQYIKTPKPDNPEPIFYSQERESKYEKIIIEKIKEIESEKAFSPANPCPLIKYCQYLQLCSNK